jgi:hypothetical protein
MRLRKSHIQSYTSSNLKSKHTQATIRGSYYATNDMFEFFKSLVVTTQLKWLIHNGLFKQLLRNEVEKKIEEYRCIVLVCT